MIKLAIVDNHATVRQMLFQALSAVVMKTETQIIVVDDTPDVLLVNVDDGFEELGRRLTEASGIAYVVAFGRCHDPGFASRAILLGARAYLSTVEPLDEWIKAINSVSDGERPLATEVAALVDAGGPAGCLTARELEVMPLLAIGLTNGEIAARLSISVKTVDTHRHKILTKLGLRNNADLARFALKYAYVLHV